MVYKVSNSIRLLAFAAIVGAVAVTPLLSADDNDNSLSETYQDIKEKYIKAKENTPEGYASLEEIINMLEKTLQSNLSDGIIYYVRAEAAQILGSRTFTDAKLKERVIKILIESVNKHRGNPVVLHSSLSALKPHYDDMNGVNDELKKELGTLLNKIANGPTNNPQRRIAQSILGMKN